MKNKQTQGKKNRAAGTRFELKVRKDLESKGWTVSKWMNNVEFPKLKCLGCKSENCSCGCEEYTELEDIKMIPAKHKFRGPGIPMAIGTGFPDFIAFKSDGYITEGEELEVMGTKDTYEIIGVEVKSNGYLTKEEKEKCKWLLDNHIFATILIASKGKKRGEIVYKEFK